VQARRVRDLLDPIGGEGAMARAEPELIAAPVSKDLRSMPNDLPPVITLLTDFGAGSGYPAQMKGVLLRAAPRATVVDLSHEVPAFDILAGALLLEACVPHFPVEAVHCAVVDPGVGTARRGVCVVDAMGRRLVGPDNGLFTPFLGPGARVFELSSREVVPAPASATFHGRDLFAPVAAWLATGGDPTRLGPAVPDPTRLHWPEPLVGRDQVEGQVLVADPFGNLITTLRVQHLTPVDRVERVEVDGRPARLVRTFGDGRPGELLALIGSSGRLEIAVREGSAARQLGVGRGALVVVQLAAVART
jgi:S-adenosylmethionine hydrolase